MKKLIVLIALVTSSLHASVWLTNEIDPQIISFFGELTGDGISDVADYYYCYINLQNNENPKFQNYKQIQLLPFGYFRPRRKKGNAYFGSESYRCKAKWISDCFFTNTYNYNNYDTYNFYGNDINNDGFFDMAISETDLAKIKFGSGNSTSFPYSVSYSSSFFVRDSNNFLFSTIGKGQMRILDVDNDSFCEVVINAANIYSNEATAEIYKLITPTNWIYSGVCKNIQCFGDWDNDGLEDFMFYDGEVILAVPEPFIQLFPLIAIGIFCRLKKAWLFD